MGNMNKATAVAKFLETRQLTTAMLKPLGISFESFLRLAQLPDNRQAEVMRLLAAKYEAEKKEVVRWES